jgi:hypothetical protein
MSLRRLQKSVKDAMRHLENNGFKVLDVDTGGTSHYRLRLQAGDNAFFITFPCSTAAHSARHRALKAAKYRLAHPHG